VICCCPVPVKTEPHVLHVKGKGILPCSSSHKCPTSLRHSPVAAVSLHCWLHCPLPGSLPFHRPRSLARPWHRYLPVAACLPACRVCWEQGNGPRDSHIFWVFYTRSPELAGVQARRAGTAWPCPASSAQRRPSGGSAPRGQSEVRS